MSKAKNILVPAVALFVICLVASVLLALTNGFTAEKIKQAEAEKAVASRSEVLSAVGDKKVASYSDDKTDEKSGLVFCEGLDEKGNVIGYILTTSAKGYGGDVKCMVGYDLDAKIVGFTILDCSNETPGLGQNAKTHFTSDFFKGKSGELSVVKDGGDVQAITAATITSRAVAKAVSQSNIAVQSLINGESTATVGGVDEAESIQVKGGESNG